MVEKREVERAANNARLNLTQKEVNRFTDEFDEILEQFEKIQEVDTEDAEPEFHPIDVKSQRRDDEIEESISKDEAFSNTENVEDEKFKGPSA